MAQGTTQPRTKIADAGGETLATVQQAAGATVLLVLDPEARATLGAIQNSLESIATLLQIIAGGGDSLRS